MVSKPSFIAPAKPLKLFLNPTLDIFINISVKLDKVDSGRVAILVAIVYVSETF